MITEKRSDPPTLQTAIDVLLADIAETGFDTEDYPKKVEQLTKLYKLKEQDAPKRVSPDTWAIVAGNLVGIVLILSYEHAHVITSKALGFVMKIR